MEEPRKRLRLLSKWIVRNASTGVLRAIGTDATAELPHRSSLVIAPHPDDETFGCGATIARMRRCGTEVRVVVVANGGRAPRSGSTSAPELIEIRRGESLTALAELGVAETDVTFLGFEDGSLGPRSDDVARRLAPIISRTAAEQVFVSSAFDRHRDHAALGRTVRGLLERSTVAPRLFEYAVWQRVPAWSLGVGAVRTLGWRDARKLRPQAVSTHGFLDAKRDAIAAYSTQMTVLPPGFVEDFLQPVELFVPVPVEARVDPGDHPLPP